MAKIVTAIAPSGRASGPRAASAQTSSAISQSAAAYGFSTPNHMAAFAEEATWYQAGATSAAVTKPKLREARTPWRSANWKISRTPSTPIAATSRTSGHPPR